MKKKTKAKLGDIAEIRLSDGRLSYVQYVNHHRKPPTYGHLIRVLPGIHTKRPEDIERIAGGDDLFVTFFPLAAACRQGIAELLSNQPIPDRHALFPLFKTYNENFETGKRTWWLWDGEKTWKVDKLSSDQFDLPLRGTVNLPQLEKWIVSGWTPKDECR